MGQKGKICEKKRERENGPLNKEAISALKHLELGIRDFYSILGELKIFPLMAMTMSIYRTLCSCSAMNAKETSK